MSSIGNLNPALIPLPVPFIMLNFAPNSEVLFEKLPAMGAAVVLSYLTLRSVGHPRVLFYFNPLVFPFLLLTGYNFVLNKVVYGDNGLFLW